MPLNFTLNPFSLLASMGKKGYALYLYFTSCPKLDASLEWTGSQRSPTKQGYVKPGAKPNVI